MPTPSEVPRAVMRLVGSPGFMKATMRYGVRFSDNTLVLLQEARTQGFAVCETFLVEDVFVFQASPSGGVVVSRWTDVRGLQEMHWSQSVLKHFIEKQTKEKSKASLHDIVCVFRRSID